MKENFHIYHLNKIKKLTEEQKLIKESDNYNDMFDILVNISIRMPIDTSPHTRGINTQNSIS
jgi:hypothetical protein